MTAPARTACRHRRAAVAAFAVAVVGLGCERAGPGGAATAEPTPPVDLAEPPLALATVDDAAFVLLPGHPTTVLQVDGRGPTPRPELDGATALVRVGRVVIVVGVRGRISAVGPGAAPARTIVDLATPVLQAWSGPGADRAATLVVLTGTGELFQHVHVDLATGATTTTTPDADQDPRGPMAAAGTTSVVSGAGALRVVVEGVAARVPVQGEVGCLALTRDAVWWLEHDPVMPHVGVMARIAHAPLAALVDPGIGPGRAIEREAEPAPTARYRCASAGADALVLTDRGVRWYRLGRPAELVVATPGVVGVAVGEQLVWVEPHRRGWRLRHRPWPPR